MNKVSAILISAAVSIGAGALAAAPAEQTASPQISISELSTDRFELVYSGTRFTSRDAPERQLLLSSARLACAHGQDRFVLLALPGEQQDVHPARPNPAFGARYGHWQPHWNYYIPQHGWQWWHPEWGTDFWTKVVDPRSVERFEVHAMVDLGVEAGAADQGLQFRTSDVIRDLSHPPGVATPHHTH